MIALIGAVQMATIVLALVFWRSAPGDGAYGGGKAQVVVEPQLAPLAATPGPSQQRIRTATVTERPSRSTRSCSGFGRRDGV